jgi:hypothetical protein
MQEPFQKEEQAREREVAEVRNGIPLLERRPGVVVTNELIDRIREAEGV